MQFLLLAVIFTVANFAYQAVNHRKWLTAFERSYFQGVAFAAAWLLS